MTITGKTIKYGDNVSTDLIFPGRYTYQLLSEEQMGAHALEDLDPDFGTRDVKGMILVAGNNWGCGSAREQAVKCLKQKGIQAIIAGSISRIYYRNCINEGLLPIICPEAAEFIKDGQEITVDTDHGTITDGDKVFHFPAFPEYVQELISEGGLIRHVQAVIAAGK